MYVKIILYFTEVSGSLSIMSLFEMIGVITFAAAVAYQAMQKHMDLFGVYILAITTAVGGGIIRDVVMDRGTPLFFSNNIVLITALISATIIILLRKQFQMNAFIIMLDAIGLGAFSVDAGIKAIDASYTFSGFIFVSLMTGIGGGILKDLLSGELPAVLHKDVYAVAALVGVVFLWFASPLIGLQLGGYCAITLVVLIRMYCYFRNINLPIIKIK